MQVNLFAPFHWIANNPGTFWSIFGGAITVVSALAWRRVLRPLFGRCWEGTLLFFIDAKRVRHSITHVNNSLDSMKKAIDAGFEKVEDTLYQQDEKFRISLDVRGVPTFEADENGLITSASQSFCGFMGVADPREVFGLRWLSRVEEHDRDRVRKSVQMSVQEDRDIDVHVPIANSPMNLHLVARCVRNRSGERRSYQGRISAPPQQ